ncbi:hypothetical protein [Desulfotomaculum nigrificans]|uniref:hypothetical protein n=1 Tax=Desulfotomaculum nigrificans TaxID=1565 RepID=UPI0001FADE44|nr:hypothetical protein [Desulfotomaculum nigrificans]
MFNGCETCSSGSLGGISVGSGDYITQLTKVVGIDEANKLLAEGYSFVSMYFNQAEQQEVYILATFKPATKTKQPIGFIPR